MDSNQNHQVATTTTPRQVISETFRFKSKCYLILLILFFLLGYISLWYLFKALFKTANTA